MKLTELEKKQCYLKLATKMGQFIEDYTNSDIGVGYFPHNIESLMADSAFAVFQTVIETNDYLSEENLLKD